VRGAQEEVGAGHRGEDALLPAVGQRGARVQ